MIKALLYNSCSSCRKTEQVLREIGVEFERREYFKDRFTKEELRSLLRSVNLTRADVMSARSRVYKERKLGEAGPDEEQMLELMIEEPTLLRRPIVVIEDRAIVGHDEKALRQMLGTAGE